MAGAYYIGKRRRGGRRLPTKRAFFILLAMVIALALLLQAVLLNHVRALCETSITNRLEALANQKAYEMLSESDCSYSDFILLSYGADGGVRAASVNTVKLNLFRSALALGVLEKLTDDTFSVSVPVGNMLGLLFFSGKGGNVTVTTQVAEGLRARFSTVFTTAGINQTRHAIGISLDFTAYYLLPTGKERVGFSINIPLGETVIVGDVPDTLTQINRITDDISEIEIDDAVDFGHVIP